MKFLPVALAALLAGCSADPPLPTAPEAISPPAVSQPGAIGTFVSLRGSRWTGSASLIDSAGRAVEYPAWLTFEDQGGGIVRGAGGIDGSQVLVGAADDPDPDMARVIRWRGAEGRWTGAAITREELTITGTFATGRISWRLRQQI